MLLKVWESISSMWCQKAITGGSNPCVLLTCSPAPQLSLTCLPLRHKPSDHCLFTSTTLRVRRGPSRGDRRTPSTRCQAQAPRPPSAFSRNVVLHINQRCLFWVSLSPTTSGL